jgi:hypothetical protein
MSDDERLGAGGKRLAGEYEAVPGEATELPQPCIRCGRLSGVTRAILREGLASYSPTEVRGLICDGCIKFSAAAARSRDELLAVITPTPAVLLEIFKNLLLVEVITESDRTKVLEPAERESFLAVVWAADETTFFAIYQRLLTEIVARHPQADLARRLTDPVRLAKGVPGARLQPSLMQAFELLSQVTDAGLAELERAITDRIRLGLRYHLGNPWRPLAPMGD